MLKLFLGVVLVAISVTPILRAWDYGLINLDDYLYLTQHPLVYSWQGFDSLRHCFTDMSECIWMPLTFMSYALDWSVFGHWYGGFHIHSVAIHFVNACLVWWLLSLLFPEKRWICLLAAMIWAVHPLRCESVVFLASRKDLRSFFWEVLSIIGWVKASSSRDEHLPLQVGLVSTSFVCFVIGSMCKPSVMTFPILCLLIDAFIIRRIRPRRYIAPVCYMMFLGVFAMIQQSSGGATIDMLNRPLWGRILGAAAAYGIYLRNFVWPQWLATQCISHWPTLPRFWLPGLVLSGAVCCWFYVSLYRLLTQRHELFRVNHKEGIPVDIRCSFKAAPILTGMLWFSIAIGPMLGIAHFGYHAFADRFTYIPSVGLCFVLVAFCDMLGRALPRTLSRSLAAALFLAVLGLMTATWRQTGYWENDCKLFSHTLEVDGYDNAFAHKMIALWHYEFTHHLDLFVKEYEIALNQNIVFVVSSYHKYICALGELGRGNEIPSRMKHFEKALEEHFGAEKLAKILRYDTSIEPELHELASVYRLCKLGWFLCDPKDFPLAKDVIDELEGMEGVCKESCFLYLKMLYAEKTGNRDEAQALLGELKKDELTRGFSQYRFLRANAFQDTTGSVHLDKVGL